MAVDARSPDKFEAILDAALVLFVERGFHGTAVPQVAKRAGIATGTIYRYFDSKEALVNALFRRGKEAIARRVYTNFPATAPTREQFRAMWHEMAAFALEQPKMFAFLELHHHASYLDAESRALENQLKDFAAGIVEGAQAAGVLKVMNPRLLMELVFGAFTGMMRAHFEKRVELDSTAIEQAERAAWDAIAATQA
ncbi:MAG: TetR/AcrR family transcriptional regulator [Myxococcales bacterium]|nr:TetR/AcrR family transcriptional regulator [Myxococcales bacterium]